MTEMTDWAEPAKMRETRLRRMAMRLDLTLDADHGKYRLVNSCSSTVDMGAFDGSLDDVEYFLDNRQRQLS